MRGVMIIVGVVAIERFKWVTLLFAAILIVSAVKLLKEEEGDEDLEENLVFCRKFQFFLDFFFL